MDTTRIVTYLLDSPCPGRIVVYGEMPTKMIPEGQMLALDQIYTPVSPDIANSYVTNYAVAPRPAFGATLAGYTLSGVTLGASLTITGPTGKAQSYVTDSDTITLDFPKAGVYKLSLDLWPYLSKTFEVIV